MNRNEAMQFAIVDIETTGGSAEGSFITEIAILVHDGEKVIDRYETLINPQSHIPLSIQLLTGIDNDMVAASPTFPEVAQQIYEMLVGRIFVAHNVNFDYSFIKHHLAKEGYSFVAPKLCTVRLSRKIKPGLPSYSLGRLCDSLGITMNNRHRAGGDADATAVLFSRLVSWDKEGHIQSMLKVTSKEQTLPPNLPKEDFEALPDGPGVYYFIDHLDKVVYVGKAKNIRKRVSSHFTGHNTTPQRQHFLKNIYAIRYESCGTELMALLLEAIEIKRLWPVFNRAMKQNEPKFGIYTYEDLNGYQRLVVGKHSKNQRALHVFNREPDARSLLHKLVREFGLCPELCMLGPCSGDCFSRAHAGMETPNCKAKGTPDDYNNLVADSLVHLDNNLPTFAIVDQGRNQEEQSCIWIEKGAFYGMGYIHQYTDMASAEDVKSLLTPYTGNDYMIQLIYDYAAQYPGKVLRIHRRQKEEWVNP